MLATGRALGATRSHRCHSRIARAMGDEGEFSEAFSVMMVAVTAASIPSVMVTAPSAPTVMVTASAAAICP